MPRTPPTRADFRHFVTQTTRWQDNDVYGHINNAVYYEFADALVNGWLADTGTLPVPDGPVICLVAETGCSFFSSLSYPEPVDTGLGLARIGTSSIEYRIGIFRLDRHEAAASLRFVHVCVDRDSQRPVPIPEALRQRLPALA